jgi:hypothetical protein
MIGAPSAVAAPITRVPYCHEARRVGGLRGCLAERPSRRLALKLRKGGGPYKRQHPSRY